jgi:VanZ family protein
LFLKKRRCTQHPDYHYYLESMLQHKQLKQEVELANMLLFSFLAERMYWLQKYFGRLFFALVWSIIILILLTIPGSLLPKEDSFKIPQFDKFVHITLFAGFVMVWCMYYARKVDDAQKRLRSFFYIFCVAVAYGITMEYVQKYFIPMRDFDLADIIADMIGAGIAYGLSNIYFVQKRS